MRDIEQVRLMHAVLDGEATSGEARDLEQLLDLEPVARSHFEELKALFDELGSVPKPFPPEGLVAAVMARVPLRTRPTNFSTNQV